MIKIYFLSFFLIVSAIVYGQTNDKVPEMVTDRPDQTESAATIPKRFLQIESGFFYEYANNNQDSKVQVYDINSTLLRYGLFTPVELRLGFGYSVNRFKNLDQSLSENGFIPFNFGSKIKIFNEKGIMPDFALILDFDIPSTGANAFQTDVLTPRVFVAASHTLTTKMGLAYNFGISGYDIFSKNEFFYSIAWGISAIEQLGLFVETFGSYKKNDFHILMDGGATYLIKQNFQIDFFTGLGLNRDVPDFFTGFGISWRIPR